MCCQLFSDGVTEKRPYTNDFDNDIEPFMVQQSLDFLDPCFVSKAKNQQERNDITGSTVNGNEADKPICKAL